MIYLVCISVAYNAVKLLDAVQVYNKINLVGELNQFGSFKLNDS